MRSPLRDLLWIALLALLLRGLLLAAWYQYGNGGEIAGDAGHYVEAARELIEGRGFGDMPRRPPVYPVFLAPFLLCSPFPLWAQLAQVMLGALSCVLLFLLARELLGPREGLLAAAMLAPHYYSARQPASVLPETLYVLLELATFLALVSAQKRRRALTMFAAGLLFGLTVLTREVLVYLAPLLVCWPFFWRVPRRVALTHAGVYLLGFGLVVAPWVARNSLIQGRLVPVTATVGHSFWIGNNPTSTGGRTGGDWELGVDVRYQPDPNRPQMWTVDADRYLARQGLRFIVANPRRFLELSWRRIVNLWRPYQLDSPWPAKLATALTYVPVVLLALPGLWLSRRRWRRWLPVYLLLGYTCFVHTVTISSIRYRLPMMPFLMLAASLSSLTLWRRFRPGLQGEDGA